MKLLCASHGIDVDISDAVAHSIPVAAPIIVQLYIRTPPGKWAAVPVALRRTAIGLCEVPMNRLFCTRQSKSKSAEPEAVVAAVNNTHAGPPAKKHLSTRTPNANPVVAETKEVTPVVFAQSTELKVQSVNEYHVVAAAAVDVAMVVAAVPPIKVMSEKLIFVVVANAIRTVELETLESFVV
jgi:hypothetical protein